MTPHVSASSPAKPVQDPYAKPDYALAKLRESLASIERQTATVAKRVSSLRKQIEGRNPTSAQLRAAASSQVRSKVYSAANSTRTFPKCGMPQ
jgi:hypothetical protein